MKRKTKRADMCNSELDKLPVKSMIFWRYDMFPYIHSAPGILIAPDDAYVPSYGSHFKPAYVAPLRNATALAAVLECVQHNYERESRQCHAKHIAQLRKLLPPALLKHFPKAI